MPSQLQLATVLNILCEHLSALFFLKANLFKKVPFLVSAASPPLGSVAQARSASRLLKSSIFPYFMSARSPLSK